MIRFVKNCLFVIIFIINQSTAFASGPWDPNADRTDYYDMGHDYSPELWSNTIGPAYLIVLLVGLYLINKKEINILNSIFFAIFAGPVITGAIMTPVFVIGCIWEGLKDWYSLRAS